MDHWIKYGGKNPEKAICIVFRFGELKKFLNKKFVKSKIVTTHGQVLHDFITAEAVTNDGDIVNKTALQLFHINYGLVEYGDFEKDVLFSEDRPNLIEYAFFKDERYSSEKELRILISHNVGIGKAYSNGKIFNFPESFQFEFNFDYALQVGAVVNFELFNKDFAD